MTFFEGVPLNESNGHARGFDHKPAPFISLRPINDSFQNKLLDLQRPIRIGRQVSADTAPTETNGYFSNKVLSRNHAELWYERGKILIKDVKSSNGTFLNGKRLSGENMESPVFEVVDGDKIEFGVDFLGENNVVMYKRVAARVQIIDNDVGMPLGLSSSHSNGSRSSHNSSSGSSSISSLSSMSNASSISTLLNAAGSLQNGDTQSNHESDDPLSHTVYSQNGSLAERANGHVYQNNGMEVPDIDMFASGAGSEEFIISRLQTELKRCIEVNTQLEALQKSVGYMGARIKADATSRHEADNLESQLQTCQQALQQARREHLRDTDALRTKLHRLSLQHTQLKVTEQRLREDVNRMERENHQLRKLDLEKDEELLNLRKLIHEQNQQHEKTQLKCQILQRELQKAQTQMEQEERGRKLVADRVAELNKELSRLRTEFDAETKRHSKYDLSAVSLSDTSTITAANGTGSLPTSSAIAASSARSAPNNHQANGQHRTNGSHTDSPSHNHQRSTNSMLGRFLRYFWPDSMTLRWLSVSVAIAAIGIYIYWHRGATMHGTVGLIHQSLNYYATRFGELCHAATSTSAWSNILQRLRGQGGLSTAQGIVVDPQVAHMADRMA